MQQATYWTLVHHRDRRAVTMADRHYSRQSPGTPEFTPNGQKIVLLHFTPDGLPAALWAWHRPKPGKAIRPDGRDVWACTMFRVEHRTVPASTLIEEATAIGKALWWDVPPQDGCYTTINPRKVPPIKTRGQDTWGYCYRKAGWIEAGRTQERNLLIFLYPPERLAQLPIIEPQRESVQLAMAV